MRYTNRRLLYFTSHPTEGSRLRWPEHAARQQVDHGCCSIPSAAYTKSLYRLISNTKQQFNINFGTNIKLWTLWSIIYEARLDGISFFKTTIQRKDVLMYSPTPLKNAPYRGGVWTPSNNGTLGPSESASQTASRSVQPFLQGSRTLPTNIQTHTHTPTHTSTAILRA